MVHFKTVDFMGCDYIAAKRRCFPNFLRVAVPRLALWLGVSGACLVLRISLAGPLPVPQKLFFRVLVCTFLGPGATWCVMGRLGIVPWKPPFPVCGPFCLELPGFLSLICESSLRVLAPTPCCAASVSSQLVLCLWPILMVYLDKLTCFR